MHKQAFGDRAPPGPAGGVYSAPQTSRLDLRGRFAAWKDRGGRGGKRQGERERRDHPFTASSWIRHGATANLV